MNNGLVLLSTIIFWIEITACVSSFVWFIYAALLLHKNKGEIYYEKRGIRFLLVNWFLTCIMTCFIMPLNIICNYLQWEHGLNQILSHDIIFFSAVMLFFAIFDINVTRIVYFFIQIVKMDHVNDEFKRMSNFDLNPQNLRLEFMRDTNSNQKNDTGITTDRTVVDQSQPVAVVHANNSKRSTSSICCGFGHDFLGNPVNLTVITIIFWIIQMATISAFLFRLFETGLTQREYRVWQIMSTSASLTVGGLIVVFILNSKRFKQFEDEWGIEREFKLSIKWFGIAVIIRLILGIISRSIVNINNMQNINGIKQIIQNFEILVIIIGFNAIPYLSIVWPYKENKSKNKNNNSNSNENNISNYNSSDNDNDNNLPHLKPKLMTMGFSFQSDYGDDESVITKTPSIGKSASPFGQSTPEPPPNELRLPQNTSSQMSDDEEKPKYSFNINKKNNKHNNHHHNNNNNNKHKKNKTMSLQTQSNTPNTPNVNADILMIGELKLVEQNSNDVSPVLNAHPSVSASASILTHTLSRRLSNVNFPTRMGSFSSQTSNTPHSKNSQLQRKGSLSDVSLNINEFETKQEHDHDKEHHHHNHHHAIPNIRIQHSEQQYVPEEDYISVKIQERTQKTENNKHKDSDKDKDKDRDKDKYRKEQIGKRQGQNKTEGRSENKECGTTSSKIEITKLKDFFDVNFDKESNYSLVRSEFELFVRHCGKELCSENLLFFVNAIQLMQFLIEYQYINPKDRQLIRPLSKRYGINHYISDTTLISQLKLQHERSTVQNSNKNKFSLEMQSACITTATADKTTTDSNLNCSNGSNGRTTATAAATRKHFGGGTIKLKQGKTTLEHVENSRKQKDYSIFGPYFRSLFRQFVRHDRAKYELNLSHELRTSLTKTYQMIGNNRKIINQQFFNQYIWKLIRQTAIEVYTLLQSTFYRFQQSKSKVN